MFQFASLQSLFLAAEAVSWSHLTLSPCSSPARSRPLTASSRASPSSTRPSLNISQCAFLQIIDLSFNLMWGTIPGLISKSGALKVLDLSRNRLEGEIPEVSASPPRARSGDQLALSFWRVKFLGELGALNSFCFEALVSMAKSPNHATGISLSTCAEISIAFAVSVLVLVSGCLAIRHYRRWKSQNGSWRSVFFFPLRVTEQDLMAGMDEKSVAGSGGAFGKVYILGLPSGELVAVKRLLSFEGQSPKALKAEIKTLAKIRHKNIVKVLGFCHSDDSILLIYEFLQKGSLGDVISRLGSDFQWSTRIRIAIGVAQGLAYLHKDYVPHLVHRNIKSKNILLDANFEPKLTDFGLHRIVGEASFQVTMASESASSCYLAPEIGYTKKATKQMDVYAFGVVLLELVTGRQAEEAESDDSIDVLKWVRRKVNITDGASQVLDPAISNSSQQEMLGALKIALHCTSVMPEKRPSMAEVVRELQLLVPSDHSFTIS